VQAKNRSMLVAVLVTSAIAVLEAWTGDRAVLLGLLIVGPLLAAASLDAQHTAIIGLYALGLAVLLGIPDRIFGTTEHLLGCLVVATGGALGALLAHRRTQQQQTLLRVTRIAEVAQQTILRPVPPRMGRVALAVRYLSASEDALVGGDFYELAVTRYGLRVLVGDVKGKGLEAVQLAALVLSTFRAAATHHSSLVELATELDHSIRPRVGEEDFVTAVLVQFSRHGELQLVNCGHPPPLRFRSGAAELLASAEPTTPLGLDPAPTIQRFTLGATDRVLLYTDGLVEARARDGRQFELDGQVQAVVAASSLSGALDGLVARLLDYAGGRLDDDLALVLAQPRW
jgi:sigma-B regulation protein RsbU (phosphoserine phosphatase)